MINGEVTGLWLKPMIESNKGYNFKVLHTMIHPVKLWIRTTYS